MQKDNIKRAKNKKLYKIFSALIVLYCFYCYGLQPYFTWKTYDFGFWGIFNQLPIKALISICIIFVGLLIISSSLKKNSTMCAFALWLFISLSFGIIIAGKQSVFSFEWLIPMATSIYIMTPGEVKESTYIFFSNVFVLFLVIPILIYLLLYMGISVPYRELTSPENLKVGLGISYRIYPLASQWTASWNPSYYSLRLCGIYNEPGVVGTYCALLLCGDNFKLHKNWKNIILLIGGILSFSLAFYAITIIYFFCKAASTKWKNVIIIIIIIIIYLVFINMRFENPSITRFQKRLLITSEGFSGNNRTNSIYDSIYNDFLNCGFFTVLFGKGSGAIEKILTSQGVDGASYKNIIYNYGYIGFLNQLLWLLILTIQMCKSQKYKIKKFYFTMFLIYCANMYQRPSMFAMQYLIILLGSDYLFLNGLERNQYYKNDHNKKLEKLYPNLSD